MHFTLADLITDITQNACESGADRVELEVEEKDGIFRFLVKDNGKGMTKEELKKAVDPFVTDGVKHPHRKIGLGLPFLIQTAEQSGGDWDVQSEKGTGTGTASGTVVTASFDTGNVDTPPAGDIPGMFRTVLLFEGPGEMIIRRRNGTGAKPLDYEVCKTDLSSALGGFEDAGSLALLGKYLQSLEYDEE